MRILLAVAVGLVGVVVLQCARGPRAAPSLVGVNVSASCGEGSVQFSVAPWTAIVAQGDSVEWVLGGAGNVDSISVIAANASDWPFGNGPLLHGRRNLPARASRMRPNAARPQPYRYKLQFVCVRPGKVDTVVIDPDMIIR